MDRYFRALPWILLLLASVACDRGAVPVDSRQRLRVVTFPPDATVEALADGQWQATNAPGVIKWVREVRRVHASRRGYRDVTVENPAVDGVLRIELQPDAAAVEKYLGAIDTADEAVAFAFLYPSKVGAKFYGALEQVMVARAAATTADEVSGSSGPTLMEDRTGSVRLDYLPAGMKKGRSDWNPVASTDAALASTDSLYALYFLAASGKPAMVFKRLFHAPVHVGRSRQGDDIVVREEAPGVLADTMSEWRLFQLGLTYRVSRSAIRFVEMSYRELDPLNGQQPYAATRAAQDR